MTVTPPAPTTTAHVWTVVCPIAGLTPGRGVAALVDGQPVAIFWLGDDDVVAVDDVDPFTGVALLSRGVVGDVDGDPTVASPLYKQRFALHTGRCLDDDAVALRTWPVRIQDGVIEVGGP
jgi:nitrite reductase (NADH) small subunit